MRLSPKSAGNQIDAVYGAVTTGNQWKFLKLQGNRAYIDAADYYPCLIIGEVKKGQVP